MKVKAYALFITLIIMLIMATLLSSVLLITYYSRNSMADYMEYRKTRHNFNSALTLALSLDSSDVVYPLVTDLYGEGEDSVIVNKFGWGIFEGYDIEVMRRGSNLRRIFLTGYAEGSDTTVLYISDKGRAISVAGNTMLSGLCYLPEKGVKRGNIEGRSVSTMKLTEGPVKQSKATLFRLPEGMMRKVKSMQMELEDQTNTDPTILQADSSIRSFTGEAARVWSANNLTLKRSVIQGRVMIISEKKIEVDSSVHLNDVILVAPRVVIREGFKGCIQVFATDSIIIERNVRLAYPSALVLYADGEQNQVRSLLMAAGAQVHGVILGVSEKAFDPAISMIMSDSASFKGMLYNQGITEPGGEIRGKLYCEKVRVHTYKGIFDDYLYNVRIAPDARHTWFLYPFLPPQQTRASKEIVKWLN